MNGAILLAGGHSSRMGRDKASLSIGGQSLLERTIAVLIPLTEEIVVMLRKHQDISYLPKEIHDSIRVGRDRRDARGPLQGIKDGADLLHPSVTRVFVLTCDLPYLHSAWLKKMQSCMQDDTDIVCSVNGAIANPLIALYRREVLEKAGTAIKQGKRRPISLWQGFQVTRLAPTSGKDRVVTDVNTPEEYQKAVEYHANMQAISPSAPVGQHSF